MGEGDIRPDLGRVHVGVLAFDVTPARWSSADLDRVQAAEQGRLRRLPPGVRPSLLPAAARQTADGVRPTINEARDNIESYRQRQKNIAYFRLDMTW
jgi:hypothetical protein